MVGSELKMRGTIGAKFGKEVWNQFVQLCEEARYSTVDRYTRLQCCGTVTVFTVPRSASLILQIWSRILKSKKSSGFRIGFAPENLGVRDRDGWEGGGGGNTKLFSGN